MALSNLSSIVLESIYGVVADGNLTLSENYTTDSIAASFQWPDAVLLPTIESSANTSTHHNISRPGPIQVISNFTLIDNSGWENGTSSSVSSSYHQQPSPQLLLLPTYLSTLATVTRSILESNLTEITRYSLEDCQLLNITFDENGTGINHPDVVCLPHAPTLYKSAVIRVIVLSAMALVSLLGNIATMWNIRKNRKFRRLARHNWSAIYSLIFHLSIADLLVTVFCMIGEAAWSYTVEWVAGSVACKLFKVVQMFSLYLSTYVLVLVGVDRWVAVKYPMKSLNTARRCHRFLLGAYMLSFVLSIPQWIIFRVAKGPFLEDYYQCVTHGFYDFRWQEQLYTTFTLIFMFIIPLLILIGSYLSTFRTISSSEKVFRIDPTISDRSFYRRSDTNRQRLIHKAKMKSLRISVVIVVVFIVCWTPYYIMMLIFMFLNPSERYPDDPTFLSPKGNPSTLDIFLTNMTISKPSALNELGSDHFPVVSEVNAITEAATPWIRKDYCNVNWIAFRRLVDSRIEDQPVLDSSENIDRAVDGLTQAITLADETLIRRVPVKSDPIVSVRALEEVLNLIVVFVFVVIIVIRAQKMV
ncbi:cardioacceleratory peptide receptor [Uranotaenia lowii]|uniref:cardioacceleratory peptide receptor n=1 Tax=Uranotaenia lowii TaxID=190385 RepID=UPI002478ABC8|nr:cardioacceleratory peptide receptor [Uranotaenia lowii]